MFLVATAASFARAIAAIWQSASGIGWPRGPTSSDDGGISTNGSAVEGEHPFGEVLPDHGVDLGGEAISPTARRQNGGTRAQRRLGDGGEVSEAESCLENEDCGGRGVSRISSETTFVSLAIMGGRSPEVGRRPHRAAFGKLQFNPAEGGEAGVNGPAEVLRGRLADRAAQDVSSFLLH